MADPRRSASRIAALVLTNALVFQELLAREEPSIPTLATIRRKADSRQALIDAWNKILMIDYVPIFSLAKRILEEVASHGDLSNALNDLTERAELIVAKRGALRHDLMGRIYHRLLLDAKYLGTYYTTVPAATLLLRLTFNPSHWSEMDWSDLDAVGNFRVADLACGTGTLLMGSIQAVADRYVSASAARDKPVDLGALHRWLVEESLWGYDVLASAIHLTASTLAVLAPSVTFENMNLYALPLGGSQRRLGSIEFLLHRTLYLDKDFWGADPEAQQVTTDGASVVEANLPDLDLVVMNPPFTRSVGGNLLFGSSPKDEQRAMQARLRRVLKSQGVVASTTAGLGSIFVALADRSLKRGGRMALVLPRGLLSGVSWRPTRDLLAANYDIEYVVTSHDPTRWNFSENTKLSEVLVVARKRYEGEKPGDPATWVNLWRNPSTSIDATALADSITSTAPAGLRKSGVSTLSPDGTLWGESMAVPQELFHG